MEISQSVEDYLETIYLLESEKGYARIKDIASGLGIKLSSVTGMLKKLEDEELVINEKYGPVKLTKKGMLIAKKVYSKHIILSDFFILVGVDKKTAGEDACRAEHVLSKKTIEKIKEFCDKKGV